MDSSSTMTKFAIYWKSDTGATGTNLQSFGKATPVPQWHARVS